MIRLTCNQTMLLLAAYRGSLPQEARLGSYMADRAHLVSLRLLNDADEPTEKGQRRITRILNGGKKK